MPTKHVTAPRIASLRRAAPRWLDTLLGVSLIAIAFAFDDTSSASENSLVVGSCVVAVATYAMFIPTLRWLNTAFGAWLMISTVFVFDHVSSAAMRSQLFIGLIIFIASLARDSLPRRPPGRTL